MLSITLLQILFVLQVLSQAGAEDDLGNLPDLLQALTSYCLVECEDSALLDSLELFNWQSLSAK